MHIDSLFGAQTVDHRTKEHLVNSLFSKVSDKYDLMNDLMSFGVHRLWKGSFCSESIDFSEPILDMAGGTGDISLNLYKYFCIQNGENHDISLFAEAKNLLNIAPQIHQNSLDTDLLPQITLCDLNVDMISKARIKHYENNLLNVNYVCAPAESLPFASESFGSYLVAYGVRNFANIEQSLKEAFRVLKPGGRFLCLEFSKVDNPFLSGIYGLYSKYYIPNLGALLGDRASYQYLVDSIERFYSAEEFLALIKKCGFEHSSYRKLSCGIVAIHSAYKK
ncbi:MAG: class I SAM-dependent methyltransferase [Rickettsiaceae bacterium]|nr:class I SAM-dependent methyltransferase [Rickettsiaceae bacterium]